MIAVTGTIAADMLPPCVNVTFLGGIIHAIALPRGRMPAAPLDDTTLDDMTLDDKKMDHRRKP